jgi:hypothetical protein
LQPLTVPPAPLTQPQRRLLRIAFLAVAATRLFAMASSPWDWDEVQFMAGVREFDVTRHQPHPAGFPIYIALANLVQLFGTSDFRSLQVVSFLAACSLFPLAFLLARELRFEFRTSFLAALVFVFLPNVWYFGGTVFSDITGTAINLAAIVMLLRGCRGGRAFLVGCALVGCALSVRPHGGFILLPPLLIATWHQFRHHRAFGRIALGAVITAVIAVAAYTAAAYASKSPRAYLDSVQHFQKWVHDVDTVANPGRTPLRQLADEFLVRPMGAGRLSMIVTALSLLGVILAGRRKGPWIALVTFAPYMVFAWLMHDPIGYHRYSTAYVAVYALLAAFALERMTAPLKRFAAAAHIIAIVLIAGRYAWWTLPALQEVRSTIAPTHAASTFAQALVSKGERIWVDDSMNPWASYYLDDREVVRVETPAQVTGLAHEFFLTEGLMREPGAHMFRRARGRVAEIHPERHFEAAVAPVEILWRFAEGWGDPEGHQDANWRWMSARSVTMIPAPPGKGRLTLTLAKPHEIESVVDVRLNGVLLERFPMPAQPVTKTWDVEGVPNAQSKLEIATSATLNPRQAGLGGDPRDLGLQLYDYRWQPLP